MNKLLETKDIAPIFNRSVRTMQLWAARGWIQGKRIGRSWFFTQEAVDAAMELR